MYCIQANNFQQWRTLARQLLMRAVPPQHLAWQQQNQCELDFDDNKNNLMALDVKLKYPHISRHFLDIAKQVACYRDDKRWALLYSLAWRLVFEDKNLLGCKVDSQVKQVLAMRKAVSRDQHKMKAFVRFREVQQANEAESIDGGENLQGSTHYIAWFEPQHLIVPATSAFFVKRFHNMRWSILTPDCCIHWDWEQLHFSEGITRPAAEKDALEDLWKTYYANIFNPARLKLKAMQSEMPKKYWLNLPEAPLIAELTRNAGALSQNMIKQEAKEEWKKTAKSRFIKQERRKLRER